MESIPSIFTSEKSQNTKNTIYYTRNGDDGKTSLIDNFRYSKIDPRIKAIGAIDALKSEVGMLRISMIKRLKEIGKQLKFVRNIMFVCFIVYWVLIALGIITAVTEPIQYTQLGSLLNAFSFGLISSHYVLCISLIVMSVVTTYIDDHYRQTYCGGIDAQKRKYQQYISQLTVIREIIDNLYFANSAMADPRGIFIFAGSAKVNALEFVIELINTDTPPLKSFIKYAETEASSWANIARTTTRGTEICIWEAKEFEKNEVERKFPDILSYFNRLSAYFFALQRYIDHIEGYNEITHKYNKQ